MKKYDGRRYNRSQNRILSIEMTYWCWWHNEFVNYPDRKSDGVCMVGKITDVRYLGNSVCGKVLVTVNGKEFYVVSKRDSYRPRKSDLIIEKQVA